MREFFILEGAYIILGAIILVITIFVTTRPFMSKGSLKKGVSLVLILLIIAIGLHFYVTKSRIDSVIEAFKNGKEILCENRIYTKGANYITIKDNGNWKIDGWNFKSPYYTRDFFLARCIVK